MESLLDNFSSAFSVSSDPNDTAAPHPRLSQYKEKPSNVPDQTTRRKRMLERQKRKRLDVANYSRKLVDGILNEEDIEDDDPNQEMEFMDYKEKRKRFNPYAYQLMLSEWLVDVPDDLNNEWLMVICPRGKRNLVIASNGHTSAYTKSGFRVNQFTSILPGGSPDTLKPGEYTILDCIFNEVSNTFYVLDIMCWRGHPVYDSEVPSRRLSNVRLITGCPVHVFTGTERELGLPVETPKETHPVQSLLCEMSRSLNDIQQSGIPVSFIWDERRRHANRFVECHSKSGSFPFVLHSIKRTEFRFYWLHTKLQEEHQLNQRSSSNPYKFKELGFVACTPEQIKSAIEGTSPQEVDGLLFYHKRTHYSQGRTPLVGWLKIHMVPEILSIAINPEFTTRAPRVDRSALIKNNLELKNTTDDKTAEEKAEYEKNKKREEDQMEVERPKRSEHERKNQCDIDLSLNQSGDLDGPGSESPMEVSSKSRGRRGGKKKKKKAESMNVEEETKNDVS